MPIFIKAGTKLKSVDEKKFGDEGALQKLTEGNLDILFGLRFVSGATNKEFSVRAREQDFFIDTLAFDEQQNSLVVIEYKKDRNFSVIDQGFSYLSAMLQNKAEFVLELNRRLGKQFDIPDVDWEQSRLIFVSPEFTNYQKNAINFKDLPFSLYEVSLYDNSMVQFEEIKPFRASASIQAYTKDKLVKDVSKQVKVFDVEDHFKGPKAEVKPLYDSLREALINADSRFKENPQRTYIGFSLGERGTKTILYIHTRDNRLRADFNRISPKDVNDLSKKLRYQKNSLKYKNTNVSELDIFTEQDAQYAANIAKQIIEKMGF